METGPNNFPPEPFTYLKRNGDKSQIQSVGLIFEPDFFTVYAYGDRQGRDLIGVSELTDPLSTSSEIHPLIREAQYALVYTPHWTLVPRPVFKASEAWDHLHFNTAAENPDHMSYDTLPLLDVVLVYEARPEHERRLAQLSPGLQARHVTSALLELVMRSAPTHAESHFLWVHLMGHHAIIVAGQDRSIRFANAIEARFVEDLRYFVLFSAKQLEIPSSSPLYLTGHSPFHDRFRAALTSDFNLLPPPSPREPNPIDGLESSLTARHFIGSHASICAS